MTSILMTTILLGYFVAIFEGKLKPDLLKRPPGCTICTGFWTGAMLGIYLVYSEDESLALVFVYAVLVSLFAAIIDRYVISEGWHD